MFKLSKNFNRNWKTAAVLLCLLLLSLVTLPALAQTVAETPSPTEAQEPTPESTAIVVPTSEGGGVVVVIEAPEEPEGDGNTDDFEVTTRGDWAFLLVVASVISSFAFAVVMGIRQGNLAAKLAETLNATITNPKTSEALERQFMNLDPSMKQVARQIIDVLDPASRFTPEDLDDRVVAWLRTITDENLATSAQVPQTVRRVDLDNDLPVRG